MKYLNHYKTIKYSLPIVAFLFCVLYCEAGKIGSIETRIKGSVQGSHQSFQPMISLGNATTLFNNFEVSQRDLGKTFFITSDTEDSDFTDFVQKLTNDKDELLHIGHQVGYVQSNLGNLESNWFGEKLTGHKITRIALTYHHIAINEVSGVVVYDYVATLEFFDDNNSINMDLVDYTTAVKIQQAPNQTKNVDEMSFGAPQSREVLTPRGIRKKDTRTKIEKGIGDYFLNALKGLFLTTH